MASRNRSSFTPDRSLSAPLDRGSSAHIALDVHPHALERALVSLSAIWLIPVPHSYRLTTISDYEAVGLTVITTASDRQQKVRRAAGTRKSLRPVEDPTGETR